MTLCIEERGCSRLRPGCRAWSHAACRKQGQQKEIGDSVHELKIYALRRHPRGYLPRRLRTGIERILGIKAPWRNEPGRRQCARQRAGQTPVKAITCPDHWFGQEIGRAHV